MNHLGKMLPAIGRELAGTIIFWLVLLQFGLKAAIGATVLFVCLDGGRHFLRGIPITRIWMVSNGLTLVFGLIDLHAATPFMIRYEAVLANIIAGLVFTVGAHGRKPMIQEIAEQRSGRQFDEVPGRHLFFKAFTLAWAGYFFIKAGAYLWLVQAVPLEQALAIRSVAGTASFVVMLAISARGEKLYALGQRWKLLPVP